jgi:class 3 adenylate cyclase
MSLRTAWNELREKWQQVPFIQRIFTITIAAFALQVVFFAVLLTYEQSEIAYGEKLSKYGRTIQKMVDIYQAIDVEESAVIAFMANQTDERRAFARAKGKITDEAQERYLEDLSDNWPVLDYDSSIALDQGTHITESSLRGLLVPRSFLIRGGLHQDPQQTRSAFALARKILSSSMLKYVASMNIKTNALSELRLHFAGMMSYHLAEAQRGARAYQLSKAESDAQNGLRAFVLNMNIFTMIKEYYLLPILTKDQAKLLRLELDAAGNFQILRNLQSGASDGWSIPLPVSFATSPATADLATAVVVKIRDEMVTVSSPSVANVVRYSVMLGIAMAIIFICAGQWIYFEVKNAEKNAIRVRNALIMHDVLARVGEMVRSMATFTLDPLAPPKSMVGTRVGVLELRLQQCLASLKVLAPTLPPLLFPKRLAILAAEYSEVKDPSTMNFSRKIRDNLLKEPLQLLTPDAEDTDDQFSQDMRRITELHTRQANAAFVFVDMKPFHNMSTPDKIQFSEENYTAVTTIVEECIYQFNGVMCSAALDKVVGVWNIAEESSSYCEDAATCGLVLASRLSQQRKQNKALLENFPVRIGVVAGDVTVGVFGNARNKVLQIFGAPFATGIVVARANGFHMTTVACDDQIRRAVERVFPCKPIELMENGDCIYEVIHEQSRKEVDLETKLSVYCKAFELYQRKYFREALRAFRAYTKLYGYDCSVERIQAIITGV